MGTTLSTLKNGAKTISKKLTSKGFDVVIDEFVDPTPGGSYGGSYVEIRVESDNDWVEFKCYSIYGFTSDLSRLDLAWHEYSGQSLNWSKIKKHILEVVEHKFINQLENAA